MFERQNPIHVTQTIECTINYLTKHKVSVAFIATKLNQHDVINLIQQLHQINPASILFLLVSEPIESIPVSWLRLPVERIFVKPIDFAELKIAVDKAIYLRQKIENRFSELFHYLLAHYYQPEFHISELSQKMQIHRCSLEKWFKRNTGISLEQYLLELRISIAKLKLMEPKSLAKQVYTVVGFQTYQAFEKQFKAHTGLTPREYKKLVRTR